MTTYVLVHGAWHGGWCWSHLVERLDSAGHRAVALDLPGHGDDPTPTAQVTLEAYVERVCEALDAEDEPVVLCGHSMGGMVITAAAEERPEKIAKLVYVCAFLPSDGDSLMGRAGGDEGTGSLVLQHLEINEEKGWATVREEGLRPAFYAHCSETDVALAKSRLVPQALEPLNAAVSLSSERSGSVPRVYIECVHDQAIPISLQRQMVAEKPCERVFTLETDHSPFFSNVDRLTACLLDA